MRHLFSAILLAISATASIAAADAAAPATQPTSAGLYLVPFSPLGNDNSLDWAGKAVQQNLLTDLARANVHVIAADKPIAATADAQTAAKAAGAKLILTGTYQMADTLVRFNGQILDTATGNVLGGISATGAPRDLFNLEDSLSSQAIQQINKLNAAAQNAAKPAVAAAPQPPVIQIIQPPVVIQTGTVSSSYQGSALQQYIDSGRTPSNDYNSQVQNSRDNDTYGYGYNNSTYGNYFGFGYGYGYGYGLVYGIPYSGYHYGVGWNNDHHHHHDDDR